MLSAWNTLKLPLLSSREHTFAGGERTCLEYKETSPFINIDFSFLKGLVSLENFPQVHPQVPQLSLSSIRSFFQPKKQSFLDAICSGLTSL